MNIGPQTDREKLIAELAHLQGYADGVMALSKLIRERGLQALAALEPPKETPK